MFDCINQLREDATAARAISTPQGLAVAAMATKAAGSLAKDVITFTVGHKLDVHVNIRSQEDVPRWDSLPVAVRAKMEAAIGEAQRILRETRKQLGGARQRLQHLDRERADRSRCERHSHRRGVGRLGLESDDLALSIGLRDRLRDACIANLRETHRERHGADGTGSRS